MSVIPWPKLKTVSTSLLDAVLPPRCPATGALVGLQGTLAPEYWTRLHFIRAPLCACCGNPHAVAAAQGIAQEIMCGACMTERPSFRAARSALAYDDASSPLILAFKHGDKTLLAASFAAWMAQAAPGMLADADYLVPVPLHRWRLLKRRYNQAQLLCAALRPHTAARVLPFGLKRVKATDPQGRKSKAERHDNIRGAFAVGEEDKTKLHGKRIVLVDDVLTSGATVNECARILLATGAAHVDVLTAARVVRPS